MHWLKRISVIGYSIVAIIGFAMGVYYSYAPRIKPYHLDAMGLTWERLNSGSQWMVINYQRSVAAGFITASISLFFVLVFPFRKGTLWSYFALFMIGISQWGNIAIRTLSVANNTEANPLIWVIITLVSVVIFAFVVSLVYKLKR